jgi:hypothetical protein
MVCVPAVRPGAGIYIIKELLNGTISPKPVVALSNDTLIFSE